MMLALNYYYQGVEAFKQRDYNTALKLLLISDELEPHFKTCHVIFKCYMSISKINDARNYIEKSYKLNPKNDKVAYEYADLLLKLNEKETAVELLKDIIQRNPSYKSAIKLLNEQACT